MRGGGGAKRRSSRVHQNLISLQIHTDIREYVSICPVYTTPGLSQAEIAEFAKRMARLKKKAVATT